jgi:hypothetical protein
MIPALNLWLAGMARAEHASRVRRYPALVEEGRLERGGADADVAAWDAIVTLFGQGEAETPLGWPVLELAASRALEALSASAEAKPADGALAARRDAVQAIHARLAWRRAHALPRPLAKLYAERAAAA